MPSSTLPSNTLIAQLNPQQGAASVTSENISHLHPHSTSHQFISNTGERVPPIGPDALTMYSSETSPLNEPLGNRANWRILIVDDNLAIHDDFRKILCPVDDTLFDAEEAAFFGETSGTPLRAPFQLSFATQGQQALELVEQSVVRRERFALAFLDVRMPPGWDGVETAVRLWEQDPDLQIVICTAYSDYSWEEMMTKLGTPERLLVLKKPFDTIEVLQLAHALTEKWMLLQQARRNLAELEERVQQRTDALLTETRRHRETAAQVQAQAALLDQARDAILVRDMDDRVFYWNKGAERLYGWSVDEVAGRDVTQLLFTSLESYQEAKETTLAHGCWTGELRQRNREGAEVVTECRWTLVRDEQDNPKGILAINSDATEKRQLEAQFLRIQRTESIGALAGGMAHDLNNLLAPIVLGLELIRPNLTLEEDVELADTMALSARRAAEIIKQVLCFARGIEGDRSRVVVNDVVRDVLRMLSEMLPKSIELTAQLSEDLTAVHADATQLHQVLLNLSLNARDAMPNGGKLSIRARNFPMDAPYATASRVAPGDYVEISVTDTGTGMSPEVADKIFEPFFTTKEPGKGTGLGLSTVFGIVRNHKGMITVETALGAGTTFRVYLPAMKSEDSACAASVSVAPPSGQGECVLLIDDEAPLLTTARQTLTRNGYRVLTAPDGVDGLASFVENQADIAVVVIDMMMPLLDGPSTIRALRRISPGLKIVAATGAPNTARTDSDLPKDIQLLQKPYTTDALLQAIHRVLTVK